MEKVWHKIKERWLQYWEDDEYDDSKKHLSQSDKRSLWYGAFMMSMAILALSTLIIAISNIRVSRQNNADVEEALSMIAAYMASATKDEYDDIAQTIRHDLVFSEFGEDIENAIQYIPNTSETCRTCMESYPAQVYLLSINTGELYGLDLYDKGENPDSGDYGHTSMSFGYDEVSEASVHVMKMPGSKTASVTVDRGRGIVSVHRMKSIFCDDCIREILNAIENQFVEEFVIFDAEKKAFYPINDESVLQIGSYELKAEYQKGDYKIELLYMVE